MNNLIYIAGPITDGGKCTIQQQWDNVIKGMLVYDALIEKGYAPILPHFSYFFKEHIDSSRTHDDWLELDFHYIEVCDYFYYMGAAKGSKMELEFALKQNKIIFNHPNVLGVPDFPPTFQSIRLGDV